MKTGIGIYGSNGHQIHYLLENHPRAELRAVAAFNAGLLPEGLKPGIRQYETLDEMINDPGIEVISLCSPVRADQAADAVKCLKGGKHVYAEKPCAMTERGLDGIVNAARASGRIFHEMAGTAFAQPYLAMRKLVKSGMIGTIVQVIAQKSYPYHNNRPQDEAIDGGLFLQAGVHAARFVEHVAGVRIANARMTETGLCNPVQGGGLKMAAACMMELENGGNACFIANYLNPPVFDTWGNEMLRIFGDKGFVESTDGGRRTRLVLNESDMGALDVSEPDAEYFEMFLDELSGSADMIFGLEEELHPLRMIIRAKENQAGR
ncbi:MAG: Gfo/Idh/MocA family oxidoreductase [Defluviitaleaceae bacterium]|nr:Gfo/Idh/MocA family oxidoreductase [Defluviitaleaceae bacterium]